jgi:hypothetical protein
LFNIWARKSFFWVRQLGGFAERTVLNGWGRREMHVRFFGGRGTEEKRPLGRPRHRQGDNIKIDQMIIECPPRRYPYFDLVVGLVRSHNPKSYAGGSVCYW